MKYAPANEEGLKPYVVSARDWGKEKTRIGWGATAADAKYNAYGRTGVGFYITGCRRATPEDMEDQQ